MDDRTDFGTLDHSCLASATAGGLYGPSAAAAAAAAAVNSGLMQLPSLADTAGRLGVMEGCSGLTPAFGCPPGLHVDYPSGTISAIGSLAQLRGWYGPGAQNQGSPYSEMFGAYAGPGSNWRNLSTPPAPDHFHSPLPGMTHPMWPCPPTPVPCSDGCSMSYYNPPSLYSAYSAYISSLMSGSAASEYSPYLSPRLPGPPPIPSYQQRLHDMHKAYLLSNSAGGHATSEFPSPWNPYVTGSSAAAPPLSSRGYICSVGQVGFGFSGETSSTSSRCISVEEQKQVIKQEPLPNKIKTKDVPADHKLRDARRDQHRSWEHSSISRQESMSESKTGLMTKKLMKDEKLPSPVASECSLDLCNNNINNNKKQRNVDGSKESVRPNSDLQSTKSIRSTETTENSVHSIDLKPRLKTLHSRDRNNDPEDSRNSQLSQVSSCGKEALIGNHRVLSQVLMTPERSCSSSLCSDLQETKRSVDEFPLSPGSSQSRSDSGSSTSTSVSHVDKEEEEEEEAVQQPSTVCLSVTDLTSNSKMEAELTSRRVLADVVPAAGSSTIASMNILPLSHLVAGSSLCDGESKDTSSSANPCDKPAEGTSCIIQHSVYFEEISNDGIETDGKTDAEGECDQADEQLNAGFRRDATTSNVVPLSKMSDHSSDSSQQASFNTKTDSDHLGSPLPVPLSLASSASAALSCVSLPSSLFSPVSFASVSMSSSSTDVSMFSAASVKVPSLAKNDAQNIPLQPIALTLYVDSSVKPQKTSVSDGVNCASGQEIDLAMPRQSMRYQVSHQRHNPMQDGCKVHAPTFLPEVCTLLSNAVTTITVSSSGGSPSSLRSASSGRNGGNITVPSKTLTGQRSARSITKSRNCTGQNVTDVSIKTEKEIKFSADSSSVSECKEIVSSGKGQVSSLLVSAVTSASSRMHILDRDASDSVSSQPVVQMDMSISKAWSQSVVGGSLFSNVLSPNYFSCLSSSAGQHPTADQRQLSKCSASQFTIANMSTPSTVTSASSKCASVGHHLEGRSLPASVPCTSLGVVGASFTFRNVDEPLSAGCSVTSARSPDTSISNVSQWDDNSVPENLSTKPAVFESEAEMATSESPKRPSVKPALLSSLNRDVLPVSRHPANSQVDGSSGNNIPVGIARALQRIIPQPAPACSSEDVSNISPDISLTLDRPLTTEGKSENVSSSGILPLDDGAGEKVGLLCVGSSLVEPESGPGSASSDKQLCWKNDLETRPPLLPASFNHAWIPPGAQPPTHPAPINPTALWMGQFPFHPGALLPYSAGSLDRSQSQHLFHPTSGYKLAQDSITGQFFFIPVPGMSWPNLGSRHIFQDPSMQPSHKEKESVCATRAADDSSPSILNCARSEEVRADVTSSAVEAGHLSNVSTSQQSDLGSNCLPSKMDHHSLPEGAVDVGPLGRYPVVYPAARPPYFFCDSNLFVHESNKQKEKTRISVESRGTSPIQQHQELDISKCSENKNSVEEKDRVMGTKGEVDHEKTTLNASVQTSQSPSLPQSPEKAFTAEISIQTSDISDSDSEDTLSDPRQKPKFSKFKKQASLPYRTVKLKDSNKYSEEIDLYSKTKNYAVLLTSTTRDPALSDISSDEAEYDLRGISSSQGLLQNCLLDKKEALEARETEITACRLGQSSSKTQCSSLITHPESRQLSQTDATGVGISDLIQAATTEFGSSCSKDSHPSIETLLTLLSPESGVNQELNGLYMLSTIASNHTPAVVSEIPQKAANVIESNTGSSVRRFNIFDLPISQFIEAERSPDVSASYNIPKSCFFDEKEFTVDSTDYLRQQNGSEPSAEDLKSGILKSDEGPENMDPMELDLRMKMAEVQKQYKQEQKELARLQRKSSEQRNNSNQKRKKSKPVLKQNLQKKASTSKQASISSETSTDSSSDDEEPIQKFSKKNSKPKNEVKFMASSHAVSNLTEDVNGIKIKVSNPLRRPSSGSVSSLSSQFQKSVSSKKEHRFSKDSSDSGKDSLTLKQSVQVNMVENCGESNPVLGKTKSVCDTTEESKEMSEMNKRKPDQPKKFDSITEDMLLKKKPKQFCFYKSKSSSTLNNLGKDIKKHRFRITDSKNSTKQKHLIKAETESHKIVDDEWYRRRSERIFLHEASVGSMSSPPGTASSQISGLDDRSLPSSPTKTVFKPRSLSQDVLPKDLTSNLKSELSVTVKSCTPTSSDILATKKSLVSSDSSGNDSNSDSDSDTDDAPLSTLVQKECATGLKSSTIGKDDLVDGLRVLYLKDELFYEGTVKAIQPPDVYRVSIDGERSSRPEIVSREQLLERAILNVRPSSKDQLSEGSRICAYWSQKFSCLYPGTVKILSDGFESDDDETLVNVEFDDGDTGKIPLAHISMLPTGYQIQESHHPPMMIVSRKRRNTADEPAADQLQRPSIVSRSMSVGDSTAKQHHPSDQLSQASGDVCSSGMKQSLSVKPKSSSKSETCSSAAQEQKGKKETQEYSCRLKTESGTGKPLAGFGLGLIDKKSSQKGGDAVENCGKDSYREVDASATDQKKTHLTLTIKRKQSIGRETSSSIDEDEDNDSSSDDEMPKSHRYHAGRKRRMKLERIDSRSASDSDDVTAAETAKRKGQKRKRQASNKSSKSKKRHHSSSSESGDQIGAFRPVWEQWQWYGPCTRRPGMKGRAKKQFYRAIQRGNEILKLGEAAVFVSMGHNDLQYVGCIDSLWESWDGNMVVKVKWYYHPEETKGGKRLLEIKSALYQSSHEDENDVQTVSHKCEVLSYTNFKKFQAKKYHVDCKPEDVFYLAGTYDPTISMITYEHDVPLNSH